MSRVFDQANIIECVIDEEELIAFLLRQDINDAGEKYFPFNESNPYINCLPFSSTIYVFDKESI